VVGERGSLIWDYTLGTIKIFSPESEEGNVIYSDLNDPNFSYEKEIENFISSIELNNFPKISGEEGLNTLLVVEAARQSNSSGSCVFLGELISK
jgi:predicted dehydrogenase